MSHGIFNCNRKDALNENYHKRSYMENLRCDLFSNLLKLDAISYVPYFIVKK